MVGIIQEQHPDRARLFMQWKEMGWPILVDSYDLLAVSVVPITLAIDEGGVIRSVLRPLRDVGVFDASFLEESFGDEVPESIDPPRVPDLNRLLQAARSSGSARDWMAYGDALAVWGGPGRIGDAIAAYEAAADRDPDDGMTQFRLGVAYRMRYDGLGRRTGDFQEAVIRWSAALALDPNQYIWRRRIQQYGARLHKPYPFYDWVETARKDIVARGQNPVPLSVEPRGSEFAVPLSDFTADVEAIDPDPMGRVLRDDGQFISAEIIAVPASVSPGDVTRIHLVFEPIERTEAHWNNEAEEMVLWVDPPDGWQVDSRAFTYPLPPEPVTKEPRTIEIEVRTPEQARSGSVRIPAYALYYVCEDVNGICMYRRQDLDLTVGIERSASTSERASQEALRDRNPVLNLPE
jgi:hypothetical protein